MIGSTTLPCVLFGGEVPDDQQGTFESWRSALALNGVFGLVVGRSLLFSPDDDVAGAVDRAARLLDS